MYAYHRMFTTIQLILMALFYPSSSLPSYWSGSCPQFSHVYSCLLIGWALVLKSIIFILAFLLACLFSSSLPCSSLPSYRSGSCPQVSHVHTCLLIGWALVLKSPMFIPAFLLVGLLSSSLPCLSLPSYWLGSCPQVSHFHPCLRIGLALVLKSPMFISAFLSVLKTYRSSRLPFSSLPSYWSGSCPQVSHVHLNLLTI